MLYDRKKLSIYLMKAKGNRSINQFSKDADISSAYLSRLLRELVDTPPSAIILKKIAEASKNNVHYNDLMESVGYLDNNKSHSNKNNNVLLLIKELESLSDKSIDKLIDYIDFLKFEEEKNRENK